jgi:hypothetical protein
MVISRWRIVHHQKGRCEDFDYYIGEINWILRLDIFVAASINYRRQFTIKTKGSSFTDLMVK